jgi:hypothetical protein
MGWYCCNQVWSLSLLHSCHLYSWIECCLAPHPIFFFACLWLQRIIHVAIALIDYYWILDLVHGNVLKGDVLGKSFSPCHDSMRAPFIVPTRRAL